MWSNLAVESLRSKPGKAQCVGRLYQMDISSGVIPHSTGPRPGMIEIKYCDFSFSLFFYFYLFFFFLETPIKSCHYKQLAAWLAVNV